MSVHLSRAKVLLQQSRPAEAEREAGLAIAQAPDQAEAHALLALCRIEQDKNEPALEAARTALGLAPDVAHFHYIHSLVLHHSGKYKPALAAIQEAIALDPDDADYFARLAVIQLSLGNWTEALNASEQALALSPEHTGAANFRSMALVRLGRREEAMLTVDSALERDPESAFSHANQGWNCLHRNDPKRAQEHFRESLRLDPTLDYAREGMIEALKARNWIYRGMLAYFLWMGRSGARLQVAVIIAFVLVTAFVGSHTEAYPILWVPLGLVYVFIYLTWTADTVFNLLLLLDKFGRHVLTPDKRLGSYIFGGCVLGALLLGGAAFLTPLGVVGVVGALMLVALSIFVSAIFRSQGKNRYILTAATLVFAGVGLTGCIALALGHRETAVTCIRWFRQGFFWMQILALALRD